MQFYQPGDLVLHSCCGTNALDRAFLILQQHTRFVRRESDQNCAAEAILSLARMSDRLLLYTYLGLTASEVVLSAAKTLGAALHRIAVENQSIFGLFLKSLQLCRRLRF